MKRSSSDPIRSSAWAGGLVGGPARNSTLVGSPPQVVKRGQVLDLSRGVSEWASSELNSSLLSLLVPPGLALAESAIVLLMHYSRLARVSPVGLEPAEQVASTARRMAGPGGRGRTRCRGGIGLRCVLQPTLPSPHGRNELRPRQISLVEEAYIHH